MAAHNTYTLADLPSGTDQLSLLNLAQTYRRDLAPTFFDSRKAPVHRWWGTIAGFSYAAVAQHIRVRGLGPGNVILDPFLGSGTSAVVAKSIGVDAIGVEAHPVFAFVSRVKTFWEYPEGFDPEVRAHLRSACRACCAADAFLGEARSAQPFLRKVYPEGVLAQLFALRDWTDTVPHPHLRDLFRMALLMSLRDTSRAKIDGVYIAPETLKKEVPSPVDAFSANVQLILSDLARVRQLPLRGRAEVIEGDARALTTLRDCSVDLVFTSPPYLNNFDYAEMTRLELYFFRIANSWREITTTVRDKLLVNSTTQVRSGDRTNLRVANIIPPTVAAAVTEISHRLRDIRDTKGGKKDYDITVIKYFNGIASALQEMRRVLKPGGAAILTLGDSGLYGVHVPTDVIIRDMGVSLGFGSATINVLRQRGYRWLLDKRTALPLRESEVILEV